MPFVEISIEEAEPNPIWHFKCLVCKRYFKTNECLSDKDEYFVKCPHCNNKLNNFQSFRKSFQKFSLYQKKLEYKPGDVNEKS